MDEYPTDYCPCGLVSDPACDPEDWCYSCCKHEPINFDCYRLCFECGHVYATPAALEDAWMAMEHSFMGVLCEDADCDQELCLGEHEYGPPAPRAAADIFSCMECAHDF